ncbi:MAG: hypothetical protein JJT85_03610 [Chromatiales bacterium]|nr:hypothetical protein [Chromatiales bacterium]
MTRTAASLPRPARYAPHALLAGRPHIIVDGAPLPGTALTLSHWPVNHTPAPLRRDTSTATAFAWLDAPEFHIDLPWVSNSHFDQDGLCSMFVTCDPAEALRHRELLESAALAGDFGVVTSREGARLALAIETLSDPDLSPLPAEVFADADREAALYGALLPRMPALLGALGRRPRLWSSEEAFLDDSFRLIDAGRVRIRERAELDLAIVDIDADLPLRPLHRYIRREQAPVHPWAVNSRTLCSRILAIQGRIVEFHYRYESWVQLASRRPMLRRDLSELRDRLNRLEAGAVRWLLDPVGEVVPRLRTARRQPGSVPVEQLVEEICAALRISPVAWDPWNWQDAGHG